MHSEHSHHTHEAEGREEQLALLKFMANHNASHSAELEKLAQKLKDNEATYKNLISAIDSYNEGNKALLEAIEKLEQEG